MDKDQARFERGFSLLELAIVTGVIALVTIVSITSYKATTLDKKFSQADRDLKTLKTAVMSYWRHNRIVFPQDVHRTLASTQPGVISETLKDPWITDPKTSGYGFVKAMDSNLGEYFILYTQGPERDTKPRLNSTLQVIEYSGSGLVVSNLPIKKLN